ncbi:putative histone deacetylase/AcuC/AphA family protein [Parvularcula bermudensis HTCC2503]|uniref:Putative histone deacetylase/AcuC/AphA family protein n=1 Tax=Parvularcula bermudensis (strain ATCC BAA-594 / HTCC2503 / KCTC 12087) TaxID=314260 RepID=E0TF48_PARBH|nr:histone deacetylase [Parvularcula bermudensis]ADM08966.1 putative histone deacetylase/AcuC/AphA family protein [Parvularcula bermudensis HTCC2503]
MYAYYSSDFTIALPAGHRFPAIKYQLLKTALIEERLLPAERLAPSPAAREGEIKVAHTESYIASLREGTIDPRAMRRIGFPWSPHIHRRGQRTVGGALAAARRALKEGLSGQLAGGTHHAHAEAGSGYCIYNDFAVVARTLLNEGVVDRIAIVDLDVHQGDGNAAMLTDHPGVYILDVFGEKNFPFRKVPATLDVPLPDRTEDGAFLAAIEAHLPQVWAFEPDLLLYQAGVDPLASDKLGRLDISFAGLMDRDRMVLGGAWQRGIPVSMAIGGGYADPIGDSVRAYANTYKVAKDIYGF